MTRHEALRILITHMPERGFFVTEKIQSWLSSGDRHEAEEISIAVLPGLDGTPCQHFHGETVNNAVSAALSALYPSRQIADGLEVDQARTFEILNA